MSSYIVPKLISYSAGYSFITGTYCSYKKKKKMNYTENQKCSNTYDLT